MRKIASALSLLSGDDQPTREAAVYHSQQGVFAIAKNNWVFIDAPSGGENTEPEWYQAQRGYTEHALPGELYNLADDPSERRNRYADEPEKVAELSKLLEQIKGAIIIRRMSAKRSYRLKFLGWFYKSKQEYKDFHIFFAAP